MHPSTHHPKIPGDVGDLTTRLKKVSISKKPSELDLAQNRQEVEASRIKRLDDEVRDAYKRHYTTIARHRLDRVYKTDMPNFSEVNAFVAALAPFVMSNAANGFRDSILMTVSLGIQLQLALEFRTIPIALRYPLRDLLSTCGIDHTIVDSMRRRKIVRAETTKQWIVVVPSYQAWLNEAAVKRSKGLKAPEEPTRTAISNYTIGRTKAARLSPLLPQLYVGLSVPHLDVAKTSREMFAQKLTALTRAIKVRIDGTEEPYKRTAEYWDAIWKHPSELLKESRNDLEAVCTLERNLSERVYIPPLPPDIDKKIKEISSYQRKNASLYTLEVERKAMVELHESRDGVRADIDARLAYVCAECKLLCAAALCLVPHSNQCYLSSTAHATALLLAILDPSFHVGIPELQWLAYLYLILDSCNLGAGVLEEAFFENLAHASLSHVNGDSIKCIRALRGTLADVGVSIHTHTLAEEMQKTFPLPASEENDSHLNHCHRLLISFLRSLGASSESPRYPVPHGRGGIPEDLLRDVGDAMEEGLGRDLSFLYPLLHAHAELEKRVPKADNETDDNNDKARDRFIKLLGAHAESLLQDPTELLHLFPETADARVHDEIIRQLEQVRDNERSRHVRPDDKESEDPGHSHLKSPQESSSANLTAGNASNSRSLSGSSNSRSLSGSSNSSERSGSSNSSERSGSSNS